MDEQLKNQQRYYNDTWKAGLTAGKEQRGNLGVNLEFLFSTGLVTPDKKILELGCGIGSIVYELGKKGCDVTGTDISSEAIAYGRQKYVDINLQVQPAEKLSFDDGIFDLVISFDVFEHIARTDLHLGEVKRILRPGGYYLFQTPNKYSNVIFETLKSKSLKWRRSHPSLQSPARLKRRLSAYSFEIRFIKMNPVNEFNIAKVKTVSVTLSEIFKRINFGRLPLWMQTNLYVIAQKLEK